MCTFGTCNFSQKENEKKWFVHLSHLSTAYPLVFVALGFMVCHAVYFFFSQTALLANDDCNELLVRFRISGFWYSISIVLSPKLLLDTLL